MPTLLDREDVAAGLPDRDCSKIVSSALDAADCNIGNAVTVKGDQVWIFIRVIARDRRLAVLSPMEVGRNRMTNCVDWPGENEGRGLLGNVEHGHILALERGDGAQVKIVVAAIEDREGQSSSPIGGRSRNPHSIR